MNIAIVQSKLNQPEPAYDNVLKALNILKKHAGVADNDYIKCKAKMEEIKK